MIYWQNEYKKTSIDFRNTLDEIGFEFLKEAGKRSLEIRPANPSALQSNEAFLFNLKVARATLDIFNNQILKNVQKEMEKTIIMIEKELTKG